MTRFYIDGLNRVDRIYFSADGKNFNSKDSEITYRESDYHTIITVDGIEYAIDDDNIHLVKDVFCEKEVN